MPDGACTKWLWSVILSVPTRCDRRRLHDYVYHDDRHDYDRHEDDSQTETCAPRRYGCTSASLCISRIGAGQAADY